MLRAYLLTCITLSAALFLFWFLVLLYAAIQSGEAPMNRLVSLGRMFLMAVAALAPAIAFVFFLALPGFIALRWLLHLAGIRNIIGFALAGAVDGLLVTAILLGRKLLTFLPPDTWTLTWASLGAGAGCFQWWMEQRIARPASQEEPAP